jgi:hypothetical protein
MDGVREPLIYTASIRRRFVGWGAAIVLVTITCLFAVMAVVGFMSTDQTTARVLVLVGLPCAAGMGALSRYVLRDLQGKLQLRIVVDADTIQLDLPAGRSLNRRLAAQQVTLQLTAIEAVEARYEAYRAQGMVALQRAFVLVQKNGVRTFLFVDLGLEGWPGFPPVYEPLTREIAARSEARWCELGMVEGKGGVLAVWGARAPDWGAAPLPSERAEALWRMAWTTLRRAEGLAFVAGSGGMLVPPPLAAGPTPKYPGGIYPGGSRSGSAAVVSRQVAAEESRPS